MYIVNIIQHLTILSFDMCPTNPASHLKAPDFCADMLFLLIRRTDIVAETSVIQTVLKQTDIRQADIVGEPSQAKHLLCYRFWLVPHISGIFSTLSCIFQDFLCSKWAPLGQDRVKTRVTSVQS